MQGYSGVVMGALIIVGGVIAGCFPRLISTYRDMPPEKWQHIDIRGLRRHMFIGLTLLGGALIALDFIIKNEAASFSVRIVLLLLGIIALLGMAQRYDHNKK